MAGAKNDIWNDAKAFRQQVRLAAAQVAQLAEGELEAALAYEVEPFSGIPASETETAWRELPEPDKSLRAFEVAVRRKGKSRGAKKPGAGRSFLLWIFGALVAAAIACDAGYLAYSASRMHSAIAAQRPLDEEIARLRANASAIRNEALTMKERRENYIAAQETLENHRAAYRDLMDAIAKVCGGRTVVKSFSGQKPFTVELEAVSTGAKACAEVLSELTREAGRIGWRVTPGHIETSAQGVTATFSCILEYGKDSKEGGEE